MNVIEDSDALESSQCCGEIRWLNGVLQQKWLVTRYDIDDFGNSKFEWRDVPTITEKRQ